MTFQKMLNGGLGGFILLNIELDDFAAVRLPVYTIRAFPGHGELLSEFKMEMKRPSI